MNPAQKPMQVSRQAVEADINVYKLKADLHQAMIDAHVRRAVKEVRLVRCFIGGQAPDHHAYALNEWEAAHVAHTKAQREILEFELMQIKQQIAIREAMLAEGEKNVVLPGAFKI
jgi:hypothetical protein